MLHASVSIPDVKVDLIGITASVFAEGRAAGAEDSESDADSCAKRGSHGNYDELNSQTQRVLRGDLASSSAPQQ